MSAYIGGCCIQLEILMRVAFVVYFWYPAPSLSYEIARF